MADETFEFFKHKGNKLVIHEDAIGDTLLKGLGKRLREEKAAVIKVSAFTAGTGLGALASGFFGRFLAAGGLSYLTLGGAASIPESVKEMKNYKSIVLDHIKWKVEREGWKGVFTEKAHKEFIEKGLHLKFSPNDLARADVTLFKGKFKLELPRKSFFRKGVPVRDRLKSLHPAKA